MVPEARLESTDHGVVPTGEGWFVLGAREARWRTWEGLGARLSLEGDMDFPQVGVNLFVLAPGEPIGMYHREADQEGFLVVAGEALLIVEGTERPLRQWDYFHCPPHTEHIILGAGDSQCVVVAVGARHHQDGAGWGRYTVNETALRHGAGVEAETDDAEVAYARFPGRRWTTYRPGWLSDQAGSAAGGAG
jgi:quercetin dioxygenase-like cupin family protein